MGEEVAVAQAVVTTIFCPVHLPQEDCNVHSRLSMTTKPPVHHCRPCPPLHLPHPAITREMDVLIAIFTYHGPSPPLSLVVIRSTSPTPHRWDLPRRIYGRILTEISNVAMLCKMNLGKTISWMRARLM